jgi:hypothetical protein
LSRVFGLKPSAGTCELTPIPEYAGENDIEEDELLDDGAERFPP